MKIVFDTNILISGFLTVTGVSQYVVSMALKRHQVILSEYVLDEMKRKLVEKLDIPHPKVVRAVQFLKQKAVVLKISINSKIRCRDKKDIPILSLAEAGRAHYLITGDKTLLEIKKMGKTLILSPREALEIL